MEVFVKTFVFGIEGFVLFGSIEVLQVGYLRSVREEIGTEEDCDGHYKFIDASDVAKVVFERLDLSLMTDLVSRQLKHKSNKRILIFFFI